MQNIGGGGLVHDLSAALAGHVRLLDQHTLNRRSRKPFVMKSERHVISCKKVGCELPNRLTRPALTAVHIEWQSDDETTDAMLKNYRF